jgi:hypothetical protein
MYGCEGKVIQMVPRGYGYKEITLPCGSTGIHGEQLQCDACLDRMEKQYPQGWRDVPGDVCKHGTYVGDAGGPDYLCGACEDGD